MNGSSSLPTLLDAIASPVRLRLLVALEDGPLGTRDLFVRVGVAPRAGRHHLGVLLRARLVVRRGDGSVEVARTGWTGVVETLGELGRR